MLPGFTGLYLVCFVESESRTIYTQDVVYKQIQARDTGNDRPSFKEDGYYPDFSADDLYTRNTQSQTIEGLTGLDTYVDDTGDVYLARGHFSPNSDFVYYAFQVYQGSS